MTHEPEPALVAAWLNTPSWSESEAFLTAHPQLCTEAGEQLLTWQATGHRDPRTKAALEEHRALLRRCLSEGIPAAYQWWTGLVQRAGAIAAEVTAEEQKHDAGDPAGIGAAVDAARRLKELTDDLGETRSSTVSHQLSRLLLERYRVAGNPLDLDRAVETAFAALRVPVAAPKAWVELVDHLNRALRLQYRRDRLPSHLDRGVDLALRLIGGLAPDSVTIPTVLGGLAELLRTRHQHAGAAEDLAAAIRALDQAIPIARHARDELPVLLSNAGGALFERFHQHGADADIDRAIEILGEGLAGAPTGSPIRLGILNDLAAALMTRYEHRPDRPDLDRAIQLLDDALTHQDDSTGAATHSRLCAAWLMRHELDDNDHHALRQAVQHGERAVRQTAADAPDRASHLIALAHALRAQAEATGDTLALTRAVAYYQQAADLTPAGSPRRRDRLAVLSAGLLLRYSAAGEDADLRAAEALVDEVLTIDLPAATVAVPALTNLAAGYWLRFERTGDLSALSRAVELHGDAMRNSPAGSPARPRTLSNLAGALQARAGLTGDAHDFAQAVRHMHDAWELAPAFGADRATYAANLAQMWEKESARTGDAEPLHEAIRLLRDTLLHPTENVAGRARVHSVLGSALMQRGKADDLRDAEVQLRTALELTPPDSPDRPGRLLDLGIYLAERYHRGASDDLRTGRDALREAYALGVDSDVPVALRAAQALGRWAERRGEPAEAARAFTDGVTAGLRLFGAQQLRVHKETWLGVWTDVHVRAAANLLASPGRDGRAAVVALEQGRALLLSEATAAPEADLTALADAGHPDLVRRYRTATTRLSAPTS